MTRKGRSKVREGGRLVTEPTTILMNPADHAAYAAELGVPPLDPVEFSADQLKAAVEHFESLPPGPPIDVPVSLKPLKLVEDRTKEQLIADGDYEPPEPTQLSRPEPIEPAEQFDDFDESEHIRRRLDEDPALRGFVARYMASCHALTESNGGTPPTAFVLDALWLERLAKMAELAHTTPHAYLETLLRRAWCAMPTRHR